MNREQCAPTGGGAGFYAPVASASSWKVYVAFFFVIGKIPALFSSKHSFSNYSDLCKTGSFKVATCL